MSEHRRTGLRLPAGLPARRIGAAAMALLAMGLVGLGARKLPGSGSTRDPIVINFDLQQALTNFFLTVGGIVAAVVVIVIFLPGQEPLDLPRRSLAKYVLGPLGILLFVALLMLWPRSDPEPPQQQPRPDTVADVPPPAPSGDVSRWGFFALLGTMGLVLVVIGRRARSEPPAAPAREQMVETEGDILAFLDVPDDIVGGDEPRAAVISAYADMVRAFTRQRMGPLISETPREFADRARRRLDVAAAAILRLTELFELARFSHHSISVSDADESRRAIAVVQRELEAVP